MATTTPTPVLNISTLVTRQHVRIDGQLYPLRTSDEFTYIVDRQLAAKFSRVGDLLQLKKRSKRQEAEKHQLLKACCQAALVAPPKVHAKLSDKHRLEIVTVFSQLLQAQRTAGATTKAPVSRKTGARSPRA